MARQYLYLGKYTAQGWAGAVKDGFVAREQAHKAFAESLGGKVISYGFCTGENDFISVVEFADEAHAFATTLKVGPSGAVSGVSIPIISAADMDKSRAIAAGAVWSAPGTK